MNRKTIGKAIAAILATYIAAYFLLMRTNAPAIGPDGNAVFSSGFVFAPPERINGDLSIFGPRVSWANYFFLPMDHFWRQIRGLTPSRWALKEEMKRLRANQPSQPIAGKPGSG